MSLACSGCFGRHLDLQMPGMKSGCRESERRWMFLFQAKSQICGRGSDQSKVKPADLGSGDVVQVSKPLRPGRLVKSLACALQKSSLHNI